MKTFKILLVVLLFTFVFSAAESYAHPRFRVVKRHYVYRPVRVVREYVVVKTPVIKVIRPHKHRHVKKIIIIR